MRQPLFLPLAVVVSAVGITKIRADALSVVCRKRGARALCGSGTGDTSDAGDWGCPGSVSARWGWLGGFMGGFDALFSALSKKQT